MPAGRKLEGRVAIVTGAASGIGKSIAELYLEHGARVVAVDLPGRSLEETGTTGSGSIRRVEIDVTAPDAPDTIIGAAVKHFDGLDMLVNNAGIAAAAQFEELTDEVWDRLIAVNVTAIFRISRAAVPHLRARGGGRIINTGSIMSATAGPTLSAYGTSKHAVAGLTKGIVLNPPLSHAAQTDSSLPSRRARVRTTASPCRRRSPCRCRARRSRRR